MKTLFISLIMAAAIISCSKSPVETLSDNSEKTILNVAYGTDTAQRMDVYLPANRSIDSTKVMIIIHGGGWTSGNKSEFTQYIAAFKQKFPKYAFFNINYRLATLNSNPFPTQEIDVQAAVNFISSKWNEYKFNKEKMVLLGASAGGHLALLQAYKYSDPKIKAVVDFFGPTDMAALYNFSSPVNRMGLQILLSGTPSTNAIMYQQSSPLHFVTAKSSPTIILHGSLDNVVPIAQSTDLKNKLQGLGVPNQIVVYPNEGHGWFGATLDDSFTKIAAFLLTHVQ